MKLDLLGPEQVAPKNHVLKGAEMAEGSRVGVCGDHVLESAVMARKDHVLESSEMALKGDVLESAEMAPKGDVLESSEMAPKDHE